MKPPAQKSSMKVRVEGVMLRTPMMTARTDAAAHKGTVKRRARRAFSSRDMSSPPRMRIRGQPLRGRRLAKD
jgi:hypothetical protein